MGNGSMNAINKQKMKVIKRQNEKFEQMKKKVIALRFALYRKYPAEIEELEELFEKKELFF